MKKMKMSLLALGTLVGITSAIAGHKKFFTTRYVFNPDLSKWQQVTYNPADCVPGTLTCSYIINVTPSTLPAQITPATLATFVSQSKVQSDGSTSKQYSFE